MQLQDFINSIEAKPNFIKWASQPAVVETVGDVEKYSGIAYISTPDGTNLFNIWFLHDTQTGEANWQNQNTLEPKENTAYSKQVALENYLKSNFVGYFINRADLENNWAEADVYAVSGADLTKTTIMVYKIGNNPITHRIIV